ncbi:unnamed protein product [Cuscuta campestris]|uniref:Uncharacterized protein n=1 Tax=Cuscuta campestris TaxID=132261 RepID=A0A484MY02_9ASTE|nr:unnamed protein product [Cuscuta campestris]
MLSIRWCGAIAFFSLDFAALVLVLVPLLFNHKADSDAYILLAAALAVLSCIFALISACCFCYDGREDETVKTRAQWFSSLFMLYTMATIVGGLILIICHFPKKRHDQIIVGLYFCIVRVFVDVIYVWGTIYIAGARYYSKNSIAFN